MGAVISSKLLKIIAISPLLLKIIAISPLNVPVPIPGKRYRVLRLTSEQRELYTASK
jgi:hypothetical protein